MVLEYPSFDRISSSTHLTIPAVGLMVPESLNRSSNVVEAIKNELDKEHIRKEIIAEEVARKNMLELELRRELMMEREIAMFGGDRFASFFKNQADAMFLNDKMGMGIGVSIVPRHDKDQISEVPFQYLAVEPNISTLNQSSKEEILQVQPPSIRKSLLAKLDMIFSGEKRKAITLTEEVADKPSLRSALVNNVTEWNCSLCQVSANKDCLNAHFQGKKYKHKEENKNWSIGLFPKKSKFIQLVDRPCDDLISSPNVNDPPSLLIDNNADDLRNNTTHEKQNNRELTFWCETCKIETISEKVMEVHRVGKKHVRHLQQHTRKDKQC